MFNNARTIEATCFLRSRWFEYLCLRPLFECYSKEDPEFIWTATPKPHLTDASYNKNYMYDYNTAMSEEEQHQYFLAGDTALTEHEPLWDATTAARCGKDIIWSTGSATNKAGIDWLKRYFGAKGIRVHSSIWGSTEPPHMSGPIDVLPLPLRPGLAVHNPTKPLSDDIRKLFKINDWEIIEAAEPTHYYDIPLDLWRHPEPGTSWILMNALSLGPNTICVEAQEFKYIDQLTKLGFEVLEIPYEQAERFGGSLHCTTKDVYREGKLEDYFPKQIKGY